MTTPTTTTPDIQTKYAKLATEFSKLRAQNGVLKKAVLDEQSKNVELTETLQTKDQSLRKLEQESDSLTFRNKQLEKRIEVLQGELNSVEAKLAKSKGKKGDIPPPSGDPYNSTSSGNFDYELLSKIEENVRLQQQLSVLEETTRDEINLLKAQLESKENDETHKELILSELSSLKSENQSLNFALQNSLDEIEAYKEQVNQLREKISKWDDQSSGNGRGGGIIRESPSTRSLTALGDERGDSASDDAPIDLLEKLQASEQQKEHWSLEYQLLKMKYDRIVKKWEECKETVKSLGREDLLQAGSSELATPIAENVNFVGRMTVVSECPDEGLAGFEKELKEFMMNKVNELVALLQYADSRAVHFYRENKSMESLLRISNVRNERLLAEIESQKAKESEIKEELDLTKHNYESQLTQFAEHLANLNDKIAEKQECIVELQAIIKSAKK